MKLSMLLYEDEINRTKNMYTYEINEYEYLTFINLLS